MNKLSRPNYGLQQQIMQTIFRLRDKKSSQIFKQPVDSSSVAGYYEKIKNPMDLNTVVTKLKQGKYVYAKEVYDDLQLIIQNCKTFNMFQGAILKKAQQFYQCIKTEWNNFQKQLKKKEIQIQKKIEITPQVEKRLLAIQQKRKKKKIPILQTTLQNQKKNILPQYSILPPLPATLFDQGNQAKQQLPQQLAYKKQQYMNLSQEEKTQKLNLILSHEEVQKQFELICSKKLNKYKKILYKKIMWIEEKIIQRCLEKKKFRKMLLPQYLSRFIEKGDIARQLSIRKIQMYVKQVTYWVEEYSQILSHYMKEKFVDTCRATRKCLLRVLRYKRIPKTTKITLQLDAQQNQQAPNQQHTETRTEGDKQLSMSGIGDQQSKRYQSKMKQFRRMFYKDRSQSTKRDTKITIKNQNGQFSIMDWNAQTSESKRKVNRGGFGEGIKSLENREYDEEKRKKEERKDQLKKDEDFIADCRARLNRQVLQQAAMPFQILWDVIQQRKYYQVNANEETTFEGFSVKPKPQQPTKNGENLFKIYMRG